MTLYLIGIGLATEKDITVRGLEIVKKCDVVYIENYTSLLQCSLQDLKKFYGKEIIQAPRELAEQGADHIIEEAKDKNIAFLVIGDPFSATTHVEFLKQARYLGVQVEVVHNASILTAVGITGLQLYKFGKTTSIPFLEDNPNLETPYNVIAENRKNDLHTLCLLDIKADQNKFMTVSQALEILKYIENRKGERLINDNLLVVGCARLGSKDFVVKAGKISEIKNIDFGKQPHCLIIPGKMHFIEEEMIGLWK